MKFSVITTFHVYYEEKIDQVVRAMSSIQNQSFKDYEHILIDDGSTLDIATLFDLPNVVYERVVHNERVVAINKALSMAKGEWICFLDADDEYFSYSLELMNEMIEKNPTYKMFNCASYHVHRDWNVHLRTAFKPNPKEEGHDQFGGGQIVSGTYFFHRSIYEDLGAFPGDENGRIENVDCSELNYGGVRNLYVGSPWDFSAAVQLEFPEIREYFMVNHEAEPTKIIGELGNPWGQDYVLFYKYTRKYHSKPYDMPIYIVHHDGKKKGEKHGLTS